MKKILSVAVALVVVAVASIVMAQSGLPNAASTNAGWHAINGASTNGPVVTVTQQKATIVGTNGVAVSVVTNVAVSIQFEPFTGPTYIYN